MKKNFHPQIYKDAVTNCVSCNAKYEIPSTVKSQQVEVCSNCHPIYTGEYRGLMTSGRVDRFRKMQAASKEKQEKEAVVVAKKSKVKKAA